VNKWFVASQWMGLALAAGLVSAWTGLSVSLMEIFGGILGGNLLRLQGTEWVTFLASFGSVLLTFMAGAEIEPEVLRKHLRESLSIGFVSFLFPFLGGVAYCYYVARWTLPAAEIGGIAISTTSVAVVYAVMVETGMNRVELGKRLLAACFVTDLGTVLALGVLFANYNAWLGLFAVITAAVLAVLPRFGRWFFRQYGGRVSELEIKITFLLLFVLGGLATQANSEAVLPAYLLGLVVAPLFAQHRDMVRRLRTTVFAFLTPFYFLRAGSFVHFGAVWNNFGLVVILLLVKMVAKFVGVWPLTRAFRFGRREGYYTTLLMSTGLTFGTISALFGLDRHLITQAQYAVLVTVVIGSAFLPTLIAQTFFQPALPAPTGGGEAGEEA
jgi:Kef-type K+ transport system membrane component KefB